MPVRKYNGIMRTIKQAVYVSDTKKMENGGNKERKDVPAEALRSATLACRQVSPTEPG